MPFEKMELMALALRCEQATGPNYALEVEIFKTIHPEYAGYVQGRGGLVHPCDGIDVRVLSDVRPGNYTASLDAAVTLIPDGWRSWTADMSVQGRTCWLLVGPKTEWVEGLDGLLEAGGDWYQPGIAATPALALTAACLRALAAQEKGETS